MKKYKIELLTNPTADDLKEINMLIPQTARKPHFFTMKELRRMISQKIHCRLAVARYKYGKKMPIVGMAAVTFAYIPTGSVAVIEDVIVDDAFRGLGMGKNMIKKLIEVAAKNKAKHIGLRADPHAVVANNMYKGLGFVKSDVVYYRINLLLPKVATDKKIAEIKKAQAARAGDFKRYARK